MLPPVSPASEPPGHAAHQSPTARPRRDTRVPYRVPCRVRLIDTATGEARAVVGETVNLSGAGLSVQLPVEAPVGTWVETLVLNPAGDPMFLCGHVAHVRRTLSSSFEIGVRMAREGQRAMI